MRRAMVRFLIAWVMLTTAEGALIVQASAASPVTQVATASVAA